MFCDSWGLSDWADKGLLVACLKKWVNCFDNFGMWDRKLSWKLRWISNIQLEEKTRRLI